MATDPRRVLNAFLAAVEAPDTTEREAVLDRECGADAALRLARVPVSGAGGFVQVRPK